MGRLVEAWGCHGPVQRRKGGRGGSNLSGGPRRQWRQRRREKAREEEWVGPGVHGREREKLEMREGSGWPYTGAAGRCRRRGARPRPVALPEAKRAFWCVPGVLVVVVQAERRGEREQGELQEVPHECGDWRTRAALGHACQRSPEREGGGGRPSCVSRTPRRPRGTQGEGPRWSEASGRTRLQCPGAL